VRRGDVCWYSFKTPDKKRPVLILTRRLGNRHPEFGDHCSDHLTIRNIPTEVVLTEADGLPNTCAANFDNLQTVPKSQIGNRIAHLTSRKMQEAVAALTFALELDIE